MVLNLSLLCRNKRLLNPILICFVLYGAIRTFPALNLRLYKVFSIPRKYIVPRRAIELTYKALFAPYPSSFQSTPEAKPHILAHSSLPTEQIDVRPAHVIPTSETLDNSVGDVALESPVSGGENQVAPSNESIPASRSLVYQFRWQPPEPFETIRPISAAQLVPRRWPISQAEPPDVSNPYTHPELIPENASIGYIPPYITDFAPDKTPPGWVTYIHPQGSLYYYHQEKNVVTNADILDEFNYRIVIETMDQLFQKLRHDSVEVPSDTQLVIDIRWDICQIGYYFATLQGRCLFWAEEKCIEPLFGPVRHVWSHSHINTTLLCLRYYRVHFQQFPHIQILPQHIIREIKGFLLFTCNDQLFNANTTSEYSTEEADKALNIVNSIPREFIGPQRISGNEVGYFMYITGNIMSFNALHRFDNHHGQPNARWYRNDFLYDDSEDLPRTRFIRLVSPFLFYTPETYYQSLRNVINEGSVFFEAWRTFVVELHQEWAQLSIIATVLLAANMAFLAIPSLDNGDHPDTRSAAQICSYISIVLSVCSIVLGQLLSRYHRIKGWERFDERITENYDMLMDIGCGKLAVMYSLPVALLSWSLITFLVAFLVMCFDGTRKAVQLSVGVPSVVILLVMVYCIYKMRDNDEQRSEGSFLVRSYNGLKDLPRLYCRLCPWRRDSIELNDISQSRTPSIPQTSNV